MTEDKFKTLRTILEAEGYQNVKQLEDGTVVGTHQLMYTTAVFIGLNQWGWEKRFCYADFSLACQQLATIRTGDDEPTGWIARRGSGS